MHLSNTPNRPVVHWHYFDVNSCFIALIGFTSLDRVICNWDYFGESQKSHLEIRSSYGSPDSFFDFWKTCNDFDPGFPKQNLRDFMGGMYLMRWGYWVQ